MVTLAAGMAMAGKRPYCYSMVPFLFMRAFEQVRLDLCKQGMPVTLIGVGGGLSYGCEGASHYAIEDLAMARSLPGLVVLAPGDPREAEAAIELSARRDGPTYIRLGRNNDPIVRSDEPVRLEKAAAVRRGSRDLLVITCGHILAAAVHAVDRVKEESGVAATLLSGPMIKPFDRETVVECALGARLVVTIEEHSVIGGLGTEVAELLLAAGYRGRFTKIGLPDEYCVAVGGHDYLRKHYDLTPEGLARRLAAEIKAVRAERWPVGVIGVPPRVVGAREG
jgi:transketolase